MLFLTNFVFRVIIGAHFDEHVCRYPVVATASKLEVSDSLNEIIKPEVVSSSSIRSQDSKDAPQTTDLVPQNRTGLLIPHFAAAVQKTTKISYQNDPATLDDPIEVTNPGFSSTNHGGREKKQRLPRKPDAARHSEVGDRKWFQYIFLC